MVDFPSHPNADADIAPGVITESAIITPEGVGQIVFLKELAKYCAEKSETMQVVCESFQISTNEIMGIHNGDIVIEQNAAKIAIPLPSDVRREALSYMMERGY